MTTKTKHLLLLLVGIAAAIAEDCPPIPDYTAEYHLDSACDKLAQNRFQDSMDRGGQRAWIQANGIYHVPNRRTVTCPSSLQDLFRHEDSSDPTYHYGYSTMWLVHNKANTPVVVSWVDRRIQTPVDDGSYYYQEVSALDGKTSPPHHDPQAILQPGEWKTLSTYDGHVFFIRQLLENRRLGPVLLQHRVGLIPIQNSFGHDLTLFCDPNDPDLEPVVEVGPDHHLERAPEFRRSLRPPLRPCNTQDIGFRNLVGCPLNVYYSGLFNMTGNPRRPTEACSFTPKDCHERFKFHLGKNPYSDDFHWAWDSQTKFEGTFVGHNFVFRLQANDDIVVDSVTVQPTTVQDCPDLSLQERDYFRQTLESAEKGPSTILAESATPQQQQLRGGSATHNHDPPFDDEEF